MSDESPDTSAASRGWFVAGPVIAGETSLALDDPDLEGEDGLAGTATLADVSSGLAQLTLLHVLKTTTHHSPEQITFMKKFF